MLVLTQLHCGVRELRAMHRTLHRCAAGIDQAHRVALQLGAVAVFEIDDVLRHLDQRRGIRGGEIFALAQTQQ